MDRWLGSEQFQPEQIEGKKLEGGAYKDDRRFQNRRVAFHDEKDQSGSDCADGTEAEKQGHQRRPGIFHGVYIKASSGRYVSYRIKPWNRVI